MNETSKAAVATPNPTATKATPPPYAGLRTLSATVLISLAAALLLPAISIFWFGGQILNTSNYVANVTPAISDPAVKKYIATESTDYLVKQINKRVNIPGLAADIAAATIEPQVEKLLDLPIMKEQWAIANQLAHSTLVNSFKNQGNDPVDLNLTLILATLQAELVAQNIPIVSSALNSVVTPPDQLSLKLIDGDTASIGRDAYDAAATLDWALPLLVLALFIIAFALAWRRRGTLLAIGIVMIAGGGFLLVALTSGIEQATAQVDGRLQADAAKALVTAMTDNLRTYSLVVLIAGILFSVVAVVWFFLPTRNNIEETV